jgi:hypothetical protein
MRSRDTLTRQIVVRLSEGDVRRLDALVAKVSISSRTGIARAALRMGLTRLEADPTKLVEDVDTSDAAGKRTTNRCSSSMSRPRSGRQRRGRK